MKEYMIYPPELQPVKVEAVNDFHAYCKAVNVWKRAMLHYAGKKTVEAIEKREAAPAVGAAQDGTRKIDQDQDTTVPVFGQHLCPWPDNNCVCVTCRRDHGDDDDDDKRCCIDHHGQRCPISDCPDYLPEEVDEA